MIVLSTCAPVSAAVYKIGFSYVYKDVYVDGYHVNNYQLPHPFVGNSGSTYIPLDDTMRNLLGIDFRIGGRKIQFVLRAPKHYKAPADTKFVANDFSGTVGSNFDDDVIFLLCDRFRDQDEFDAMKKADELRAYYTECLNSDDIVSTEQSKRVLETMIKDLPEDGKDIRQLPLKNTDLYLCDGILYVKASAFAACEDLPFSIYYDPIGGFAISTDPNVSAKDQFSENNKSYVSGRIAYIRHIQKNLSDNDVMLLEYLFRHEAYVNGISQDLNMAVAQTESTFSFAYNRVSGKRPIGLMQVMPGTVTANGYDLDFACTPHGNIQIGTAYIAAKLSQYSGSKTLALSAYNQGSGTVASGHYSTGYANKVCGFENDIRSWCASHGYSNSFYEVSEKVR